MINTLYIGSQYSNNMGTDTGILPISIKASIRNLKFTGLNITNNNITLQNPVGSGTITSKLDILVYNKILETGNILSSIVYISVPRTVISETENVFVPQTLYKNSFIERLWSIPTTNFKYVNTLAPNIVTTNTNILDLTTRTSSIEVMPANVISKDIIMKDGWYSIMSVGVVDTTIDPAFVSVGTLVQDTTNTQGGTLPEVGAVYIALVAEADPTTLNNTTMWSSINQFNNTANLGQIIYKQSPYNPWVKKDILWLSEYDLIYRDVVLDFVKSKESMINRYTILKGYHTVIDYFATLSRFDMAQITLQGTLNIRTNYNSLKNV